MSAIKQCLHRDPDSEQCLQAHRLVKKLDKQYTKLETLKNAEDWRNLVPRPLSHFTARLRYFSPSYLSHRLPTARPPPVRTFLRPRNMSTKTIAVLDESELKDGEM